MSDKYPVWLGENAPAYLCPTAASFRRASLTEQSLSRSRTPEVKAQEKKRKQEREARKLAASRKEA